MKRREFLKKAVAGGAGFLAGTHLGGCSPSQQGRFIGATKNFDPCESVTLGRSSIKATRLGFGTGMKGGRGESNLTRLGRDRCQAVLRHGYDRGIRFFDCADIYGTHPYIIPALRDIPRHDYVISSKVWLRRRRRAAEAEMPDVEAAIQRFLKELNTNYIDIVQIHCVIDAEWNEEFRKQMDILAELKRKGIIRAHGVSVHSLEALKTAADEPWVDIVHARINAYGDKMDATCEEVEPVIRRIHDAGKGLIAMKLIGEGDFRYSDEKIDGSIDYALNLGCVNMVIIGFEDESEIDNYQQRIRKTLKRSA